jgi:phage repressor protein C with HTH and peptisase S24 domain
MRAVKQKIACAIIRYCLTFFARTMTDTSIETKTDVATAKAVETMATAKPAETKPAPTASNAAMNNLARNMSSLNLETMATAKPAETKPAPTASNAAMNNLARNMSSLNLRIEHPEMPVNIRYYPSSHFVQSGEHPFQEYARNELEKRGIDTPGVNVLSIYQRMLMKQGKNLFQN